MTENSPSLRESAGLSRRRVVGTALWTPPAVTLAAAAPAFAASQTYDLRVQTFQFNEALNWTSTNGNNKALYGVGYVTWRVRVCNDGPLVAPSGTVLAVGVGMGPYFDDISLVSNGGLSASYMGNAERYQVATNYEDDAYFRSYWKYTLGSVPVGCFDLTFKARLRRQPIDGYNRVRDVSNTSLESKTYNINTLATLTPPGSKDRTSSNNSDTTDTTKGIRVHVNSNSSTSAIDGTYTDLPQS